ncbi:hypothetical protein [Sphingomonas sp. Leaf343]|uniref:hypothetical protein n=1 Tax=Sphingomonas sp. Leaf343 TaxID=1736345 RepID=UPI00144416F6|nr:hypothetical protein [Sphingomonas sp. Leaf343]
MTLTLCGALAALGFALPAQACRVFRSPEQRIEDVYAQRSDIRVALVSITDARHLSNQVIQKLQRLHPNYQAPWRVTASVAKMIVGDGSPELVVFDRGWGGGSCDDGTAMPRRGDHWVVYYTSDTPIGPAQVLESYPLSIASRIDPRLHGNGS